MITFEATIKGNKVRMYAGYPLKNAAGAIFNTLSQICKETNADIFNEKFVMGFGWSFFYMSERKEENGEKFWVLQTNDYRKNPMTDKTDDVTAALIVQNMQIEAVRIANVQPEASTFKDTVLVLKEAMNAPDVYMNRAEPANNGDSGWYLGLLDDPNEENHSEDEYEKVPAYEFFKFRSEALRVLEMPVGTFASFHDNVLTSLADAEGNPLKFTTDEERQRLADKQKAEFAAEVAKAQARAAEQQAEQADKPVLREVPKDETSSEESEDNEE